MKKIVLLAVAFVALTAVSCKKDKTCKCTTTETNSNVYVPNPTNSVSSETKYTKISKGDANKLCPATTVETDNNNMSGASANVNTKTTTCSIS